MGPVKCGKLTVIATRATIAAADSTHPNSSAPAAAAILDIGAAANGLIARSRDAVVEVWTTAAQAGVSITVTLYGSVDNSAGSWRRLGPTSQLNNGAAITPSVPAGGTTHTNRIAYTQWVPGLLEYPYIYPEVTGTIAADTTNVRVLGEIG